MCKPATRAERLEVIYDKKRRETLRTFRDEATRIMEILDRFESIVVPSVVFGSVARGDVSESSDVDIFVPKPPSSFIIETALENAGVSVERRVIVQATPAYAAKGYIELDDKRCISFPLVKLRPEERELYIFGGEATLPQIKDNVRVPGVDKRLMLIEPTPRGHVESTIIGQEGRVARSLGVSLKIVSNRIKALLRRNAVGRTGVFVERTLSPDETFEVVLKKLADKNPAVRRRLRLF